jgi:hypothetical protein
MERPEKKVRGSAADMIHLRMMPIAEQTTANQTSNLNLACSNQLGIHLAALDFEARWLEWKQPLPR